MFVTPLPPALSPAVNTTSTFALFQPALLGSADVLAVVVGATESGEIQLPIQILTRSGEPWLFALAKSFIPSLLKSPTASTFVATSAPRFGRAVKPPSPLL